MPRTRRTPDDNIVVGDPYSYLSAAIVDQAYKDLTHIRRDGRVLSQNYPVTITELTGFFESEWFDSLVSIFEINPDNARVHIGIN